MGSDSPKNKTVQQGDGVGIERFAAVRNNTGCISPEDLTMLQTIFDEACHTSVEVDR